MEEVAPGVALAAGGDLLLAQALTPQSPPGHVLVHLTLAADLAPTHDQGMNTRISHTRTHARKHT